MNQTYKIEYKKEFTNIEVFGAEALFNRALNEHLGYDDDKKLNEELFVTGGCLNSTSAVNGYPLDIDGYSFHHCILSENHILYACCYTDKDVRVVFEVTYNDGFRKV